MIALGVASLLALAPGSTVRAAEPPLTLAEAQRLATLRSKQVEASDLALSASKDLAVAAAERPDPIAKVGLENLPIEGPERFSVQRDFMTMRSVGIMQEITRPTKLRARAAESEQAMRLAQAQKAQALVSVQRDTALAWLDRYYAEALEQTVVQQVQVARLDVTAAADGILRIAATAMSYVVKGVTTERGLDVGDFALVAYGGAGPLHAA